MHSDLIFVPNSTTLRDDAQPIISSVANGLASDLAQTILMATTKQIVFAPAMNVRMWENKLFQKNIEVLKSNGSKFVGPTEGEMACGEFGMGRMMEPQLIVQSLV